MFHFITTEIFRKCEAKRKYIIFSEQISDIVLLMKGNIAVTCVYIKLTKYLMFRNIILRDKLSSVC